MALKDWETFKLSGGRIGFKNEKNGRTLTIDSTRPEPKFKIRSQYFIISNKGIFKGSPVKYFKYKTSAMVFAKAYMRKN